MLLALFAHAPIRTYTKHTVLGMEGGRAVDSVYLIRSGKVKLFLCSADGKKVDIDVLQAGDYFGELQLDGGPAPVSAMTMERSQLAVIRLSEFRQFVSEHRDHSMQLILKLIARTRALLKTVKSLALLGVSDRVARLLLEMATEEDGKLIIAETLSKRDIANRVGATREMASRAFKNLVSSGYIQLDHKKITIAGRLPRNW